MTDDDLVNALRGKLSKQAVQYSNSGHADAHCAICEHYEGRNNCELVAGKVVPSGWCLKFEKK